MRPRQILAVGYLSIDTIETTAGRFERVPGGAALYAALGVRHAGGIAAVAAAVGEDYPAQWLDALAALGIDISRVQRRPGPTRTAGLQHSAAGNRASSHHADDAWWRRTAALAPPRLGNLAGVDGLVAGPMPPDSLSDLLQQAARPDLPVVADTSEAFALAAPASLINLLSRLAVFAPSREETRLLLPDLSDDAAASSLARRGVHIVQKRGAQGAWAVAAGGGTGTLLPAPHATMVDPTGAGDATVGALALRLARGESFLLAAAASLMTGAAAVSGIGPAALGLLTETGCPHLQQGTYELSRR